MKRIGLIVTVPFLILFLSILNPFWMNYIIRSYNGKPNGLQKGTAIVITGAAARIPQEAALLEQLYNTVNWKMLHLYQGQVQAH